MDSPNYNGLVSPAAASKESGLQALLKCFSHSLFTSSLWHSVTQDFILVKLSPTSQKAKSGPPLIDLVPSDLLGRFIITLIEETVYLRYPGLSRDQATFSKHMHNSKTVRGFSLMETLHVTMDNVLESLSVCLKVPLMRRYLLRSHYSRHRYVPAAAIVVHSSLGSTR